MRLHSPDQLRVAVLTDEDALVHWDWLKWLPHAGSPRERDGAGPARMVSAWWEDLVPLLRRAPTAGLGGGRRPAHLLLVVDGGRVPPGDDVVTAEGVPGVTVLDLPAGWDALEDERGLRLVLDEALARTAACRCARCG